jgi:hypothetical protein
MNPDVLIMAKPTLRGTDSNTLLRMFDLASGLSLRAQSQQERARADKAVRLFAKELQRRNVSL